MLLSNPKLHCQLMRRLCQHKSMKCIIEGLKNCLYPNNSKFASVNLLQTIRTATGALNLCCYADIAVASIGNAVLNQKATCFDDFNGEIGIVLQFKLS